MDSGDGRGYHREPRGSAQEDLSYLQRLSYSSGGEARRRKKVLCEIVERVCCYEYNVLVHGSVNVET